MTAVCAFVALSAFVAFAARTAYGTAVNCWRGPKIVKALGEPFGLTPISIKTAVGLLNAVAPKSSVTLNTPLISVVFGRAIVVPICVPAVAALNKLNCRS